MSEIVDAAKSLKKAPGKAHNYEDLLELALAVINGDITRYAAAKVLNENNIDSRMFAALVRAGTDGRIKIIQVAK